MPENKDVLGAVLDQLETAGAKQSVSIGAVVETAGASSFATLMLIFALIAVSPATIIPGVTSTVALLELILVTQMIFGARHLWLPKLLSRREIPGQRLRQGVAWLRRPVALVDQILQPRLRFLTEKPALYFWLVLILMVTLVMPFMELVPGAGTVAATFIALVAAAVLTRDGVLLMLAALCFAGLLWMLRLIGAVLL